MELTMIDGGLGHRSAELLPCRTSYGEVWEIGDHYLVVGNRRPKFMFSRVAETFCYTEEQGVEAYQDMLKAKVRKGEIVEDYSKVNTGNLLTACILEGVCYRGYVTQEEAADFILNKAEYLLCDEAYKLS